MIFDRSSGVQLHISSLPGGRLGAPARKWVDWLARAGQSWWQVLPLTPPDRYGSPYKSRSAFACWNGYLADPAAPVSREAIERFMHEQGSWPAELPGGRRAIADQVRFEREWDELRAYGRERGVRVIGDVPIYVAPGGIDQRAHPEFFRSGLVAGAPPDAYSAAGQLWGNPLYNWPVLRRRGYAWWIARLKRTLELFDVARIDHFRGFVAAWGVPEGDRDARGGRWLRGPGAALWELAGERLGAGARLPLIAEDLGLITPAVTRLRRRLGFPGMVVLQFAFDPDDPRGPHRLEKHRADQVAYTGTHDSDTLAGWYGTLSPARRREADAALRSAGLSGVAGLIRLWMSSPCPLVMMQLQDVLELGSEARMNVPGRARGSWRWHLDPALLTRRAAARLRAATAEAGRLP
ncbi:MAG: 4-alpha-glucanotransferase [Solirubrobacteraceae bacterium]